MILDCSEMIRLFEGPHPPTLDDRDHTAHPTPPNTLLGLKGASFKKLANVDHEQFRHVHLLYSSRNFLAHELREGSWHTIAGDVTFPHYSYTKIESAVGSRERWLLYYPVEFFASLAATCLIKLEEWLKVEHIDPYERRRFGDFFLEQLN
jgi:hypothetical protein